MESGRVEVSIERDGWLVTAVMEDSFVAELAIQAVPGGPAEDKPLTGAVIRRVVDMPALRAAYYQHP
jgi:hypothetical protein